MNVHSQVRSMRGLHFVSVLALTIAVLWGSPAQAALIGHWSFDEGSGSVAMDSSGNNLDGTINGASYVTGQFGTALSFDGNDDVQTVTNSLLGLGGSNQFSVNLWVNATGTDAFGCCGQMVGFRNGGGWSLRYDVRDSNPVELITGTSAGAFGDSAAEGLNPTLNQWQMVTAVVDVSQLRLYLDGALQVTAAWSGVLNPSSNGGIMRMGLATDGGFIGALDEVRVYNHALQANEISDLFSGVEAPVPAPMPLLGLGSGICLLAVRRRLSVRYRS